MVTFSSKNVPRRWLGSIIWLHFAFDLGQFLDVRTLKAQQENIAIFRSAMPALTILIFFNIYVLSIAVSLPAAALLTLASGTIFGLFWGTLIMSRFLLRDGVMQRFGLEKMGISAGKIIDTNEFLQTRFPNIYAAGDVAGPFQFTHTAAHQAWYAAVNALFDPLKKFKTDYSVIPWATFVEPEVARVGLNEQEAKEKSVAYESSVYAIDELDREHADSEAHGFIKVLTVPGKDRILGVTIVGEHAGDLIAEYVLAMKQGIGLNKILGTIHIYPTLAEANKYVAGVWKRAHAPQRLLAWVERFHAWRRG